VGWMKNFLNTVAGVPPVDWTLIDELPDPGLGISGKEMKPDECYVELYVESLRLAKARRFATKFDGVIYSFASLAREGTVRAQSASVTKPQNLANLDANNLGQVITFQKRMMRPVPWRGGTLALELGLFSVKTGNLLSPLINYVAKIAEKAGSTSLIKLDPFFPLITEGLDMIAGQKADTEIELAIDTDLSVKQSCLCALIAQKKVRSMRCV
jgi:hypothetical protein